MTKKQTTPKPTPPKSGNMNAAADTKVPPAVMEKPAAKSNSPEQIADKVAQENKGEVLRFRIDKAQLIILLVDGRKFYKDLVN